MTYHILIPATLSKQKAVICCKCTSIDSRNGFVLRKKFKNQVAFLLIFDKHVQDGSSPVGYGQYFLRSLRWPLFLQVCLSLFRNCSQGESEIIITWGRGERCTMWGTEKKEKYF